MWCYSGYLFCNQLLCFSLSLTWKSQHSNYSLYQKRKQVCELALNRYIHFYTYFCLVSDDQGKNVCELFMLGAQSRKVERKWAREHLFLLFYLFHPLQGQVTGYCLLKGDGLWTWLTCFDIEGVRKPIRPVVSPTIGKSKPFLPCVPSHFFCLSVGEGHLWSQPLVKADKERPIFHVGRYSSQFLPQ